MVPLFLFVLIRPIASQRLFPEGVAGKKITKFRQINGELGRCAQESIQLFQDVKRVERRRQPIVNTKHLIINLLQVIRSQNVDNSSPSLSTPIFILTFIVHSIHLGKIARFVICSQQEDSVRIKNFQRDEYSSYLQTLNFPRFFSYHKSQETRSLCLLIQHLR